MSTSAILGLTLLTVVVAVVLVAVASRAQRLADLESRAAFIQRYAFPAEIRGRLERELGLTLAQSGRVLDGLRQYFLACLSAQRSPVAAELGMPSRAVDLAWHEFILRTREYAWFCEQAFGRYLHHTPQAMMAQPSQWALANTLHEFRQPALAPTRWTMVGAVPLLFAIDRELRIADGYFHDAATLAELEAVRRTHRSSDSSGGHGGSSCQGDLGCSLDAGVGGCGGGGGGSCGGAGCGGG